MTNQSIAELAKLIPLQGWEAIKSSPAVLAMISKSAGIITSEKEDPDELKVDSLFKELSLQNDPCIIYVACAVCLDDDLRPKALNLLSNIMKSSNDADASQLVALLSSPVFSQRPDGLNYILAARLLPVIYGVLYEMAPFFLDGLNHEDANVRKQSLFMLKYIIITSPREGHNGVLYQDKSNGTTWRESWNTFFLLYDTFQEPQSHLLEPLFPLLHSFLLEDAPNRLGFSWWECIVRRAFTNTSVAVRKRILEHIIIELPMQDFPVLCNADEFVFGSLLKLVDNSYLYSAIDFNRLVSPFGLSVTRFYTKYLSMATDEEGSRRRRVKLFFSRLKSLTSNLAIVFLLNALLEVSPVRDLLKEDTDLTVFSTLAEHCGFHNAKARAMLRWQLVQVMCNFSTCQSFTIGPLCSTLGLLLSEVDGGKRKVDVLDMVSRWFCENERVKDVLVYEFESILAQPLFDHRQVSQSAQIVGLGIGLLYRLGKGGHEFTVSLLKTINQALEGKDFTQMLKCCVLLEAVEKRCVECANLSFVHGIATPPKLFAILAMLESTLIPEQSLQQQQQQVPLSTLLNCMQLIISELTSIHDPSIDRILIEFMDMMWIKCSTAILDQQSIDNGMKIAVCGASKLVIETFNNLQFPTKGTINQAIMIKLVKLELVKTHMSDDDLQVWPLLKDNFAELKWCAVVAYCKHVADIRQSDCSELYAFYEIAMDCLADSHFNAAVSLINGVKVILRIFVVRQQSHNVLKMCTESWQAFRCFIESMEDEKSRWFNIYAGAIVDCLLQDCLVHKVDLHDQSGPLYDVILYFMRQLGPHRRGLLPYVMTKMYEPMRSDSRIRRIYLTIMPELLMYGPVRAVPEERLADAMHR